MSICFLSLETSKLFNKLILENLEKKGFHELSEALIILFPYINENKNITISQLSKKVGYSRQAMHKNIKKLESSGYIVLISSNQKEKIISFTSKSEELMIEANDFISIIEKELEKLLGKKELECHIKNQIKIFDYLENIDK
jgi:DNA-binding MarR family transcriptional regulator